MRMVFGIKSGLYPRTAQSTVHLLFSFVWGKFQALEYHVKFRHQEGTSAKARRSGIMSMSRLGVRQVHLSESFHTERT